MFYSIVGIKYFSIKKLSKYWKKQLLEGARSSEYVERWRTFNFNTCSSANEIFASCDLMVICNKIGKELLTNLRWFFFCTHHLVQLAAVYFG